jgi:uncharacterized protein (DUF2267 family)
MSVRSLDAIERTVHKTNQWLNELTRELAIDDEEAAWRLLRGVYYEDFDPSRQSEKTATRSSHSWRDVLGCPTSAHRAATATTRVLRRHITKGELDDVISQLPKEICGVLEPAVA